MRVHWTRPALAGLTRVIEFLQQKSPTAAQRASTSIRDAAARLAEFPHSGRPYPRDPALRELLIPFGAHGYSILYELRGDVVIIARLRHMREASY